MFVGTPEKAVGIATFPLGAGLGSLWHGLFPSAAPLAEILSGVEAGDRVVHP